MNTSKTLLLATTLAFSPLSLAKDVKLMFSIDEAMNTPAAKASLNQGVKFYFGTQKHKKPKSTMAEVVSNKKTNGFNKTEQEACNWVFLSAMKSLQKRAQRDGGNAVIDIVSYYKKNENSSNAEFECHDGTFVTGVALKGTVVRL